MRKSALATAVATILVASMPLAGKADGVFSNGSLSRPVAAHFESEVVADGLSLMRNQFGADLVLLGRVDQIGENGDFVVLGQRVTDVAAPGLNVGDFVAVTGAPAIHGVVNGDSVLQIAEQYIAGATRVFVRGEFGVGVSSYGTSQLAGQTVDLTNLMSSGPLTASDLKNYLVDLVGIQPMHGGVLLAQGFVAIYKVEGSLGTGRVNGSLGTGRGNGSLGTGKVDGSLGTGRVNGSLGTGRGNGSLGTGKVDGSLGTGRVNGSLGTGRGNGSLGTGKVDGSLGTGRVNGSLGTGRGNGSLGTGKVDGSLGTGRVNGSLGTGRGNGSLGTGKVDGSLGTG